MSEVIIHIVDDDASFLRAVSRLIRAAGHAVKTFSSAADFLACLAPGARGCVIADLRMPGLNGLDLQESLARSGYHLPLIFLTGHGDVPTSVRAMRNGAEDFLLKLAPRERILEAISRAIQREQREHDTRMKNHERLALLQSLTPREREVLERVVAGKMNKQIAAELFIDERTVKFHRTNITTKLRVDSVAELVHLARECGVTPVLP